MVNKLIIYALTTALVVAIGYGIKEKIVNVKISSENDDLNLAVEKYEEMIKVLPFNVLSGERKDKANEEINTTLSNDNAISDGIHRL